MNDEKIVIGTIDFGEDVLSEEKVESSKSDLNLSSIGKCIVEIFSREGTSNPHFHVSSTNGKFKAAVMIYKPEYFIHNEYVNTFNSKQKDILDKWLRTPYKKDNSESVWDYISNYWIRYFGPQFATRSDQPNYNDLPSVGSKAYNIYGNRDTLI